MTRRRIAYTWEEKKWIMQMRSLGKTYEEIASMFNSYRRHFNEMLTDAERIKRLVNSLRKSRNKGLRAMAQQRVNPEPAPTAQPVTLPADPSILSDSSGNPGFMSFDYGAFQ